jgi:hypothetical protein
MCRDRIYFEKSNGEEHQLSSIINIVTGTPAFGCEKDARTVPVAPVASFVGRSRGLDVRRGSIKSVFDAFLGTFRDQLVNMTAREGR